MAFVPPSEHSAQATLMKDVDITPVSELFFSQKNVDLLHQGMRYLVYKHSGCKHVISKQSDTELQIIMLGIYKEYAKNNIVQVVRQVRDLNALVLDFAVPRILREIDMHLTFSDEVFRNTLPMDRPQSVSTAGTKLNSFREA